MEEEPCPKFNKISSGFDETDKKYGNLQRRVSRNKQLLEDYFKQELENEKQIVVIKNIEFDEVSYKHLLN